MDGTTVMRAERYSDLLSQMRYAKLIEEVSSAQDFATYCCHCRANFSVWTGTFMPHSTIPLQKSILVLYLWSTSLKWVSSMRLHREFRITQKSTWHLLHSLRKPCEAGPIPFIFPLKLMKPIWVVRNATSMKAGNAMLAEVLLV